MTEELKEVGGDVGHRRVGRLMRETGIVVERTRKFKATTDSDHMFNIAPNLQERGLVRHWFKNNGRMTSREIDQTRNGLTAVQAPPTG